MREPRWRAILRSLLGHRRELPLLDRQGRRVPSDRRRVLVLLGISGATYAVGKSLTKRALRALPPLFPEAVQAHISTHRTTSTVRMGRLNQHTLFQRMQRSLAAIDELIERRKPADGNFDAPYVHDAQTRGKPIAFRMRAT